MNYYQILEIDKNFTTKEIKKHYYQLAKKYHPDLNKGDFEKAQKYCDEDTAAILAMAESLGGKAKEEMKGKDVKINIISSEVNEEGDKATVKYTETTDGETSPEKSVELKKIDGDWKVSMDKESMKKEDGMTPPPADMDMEMDDMNMEGDTIMEGEGEMMEEAPAAE